MSDQRPTLWRAGCVGTRTSGSEGGGEQTTARKRGMAARLRPYHSIIQRKLLDPNDFDSTAELARALNDFERRYNVIAEPFEWTFTRDDLADLLARLGKRERDPPLALAA